MGASGIYQIQNKVNGRAYIGSAINLERRNYEHFKELRGNYHKNRYLQRAWLKYGEEAFEFSVVELVEDAENLIAREQVYLDKAFASKDLRPYNICRIAGSLLGIKFSAEARARMSARAKGRIISPEQRAKMSAAMKGRIRTAEHRAKLGAARQGKKMSEEFCRRNGELKRGHKQSAETIEKRVAKLRGRKMPVEHVQKLSDLYRSLTKEQVAEIVARRKAGESYVALAKAFNSTKDTIRNWCMREGLEQKNPTLSPDVVAEIVRRRRAGESLSQVSKALGVSEATVSRKTPKDVKNMAPTPTSPDRPAPEPLSSHPDQLSLL